MKQSNLIKGLVAALAIFALGTPALASADAKSELKGAAVKVSYGDLDLEKSAGAKALYRRLQQASRQVCDAGVLRGKRSVREMSDARRCYEETLAEAVARVDNDLVTQLHTS